MKKLFLLLLFVLVVVSGVFIIRKNPEDQLKKIVYPSEYRVMTYNIHHGVGTDGLYSLSRIARIIREQSPHIVCLNEVDFKTERTYRDDQARKIAAELGMEFTFARNLQLQGGWYGNAILSKFPIDFSENKLFIRQKDEEQRALLHTIINMNNKKLHFYGTHLSVDSLGSAAETKELLGIVLEWGLTQPVIIAGDLNMTPTSQRINEIAYYFYDLGSVITEKMNTYPSTEPVKRIDYIFTNDKIVPISVYVVDNENTRIASDHLPVVAKFRIK